jgi:hypothetical protein
MIADDQGSLTLAFGSDLYGYDGAMAPYFVEARASRSWQHHGASADSGLGSPLGSRWRIPTTD